MVSEPGREHRIIWSLYLAAGIVFIGGLLPLFFGGTSSRVSSVLVPFTIGAIGLAACGLLHDQNRTAVAVVYFVAGLAIVYGLLSMFALPIRLAALGSCPVAPYPCTSGLPRALSDGENNGIGSAAAFGLIGLFVGFFGLFTLYRRPTPPAFTPPVRSIPPVQTPVQKPAAVAVETNSSTPPASNEKEPEPELPADEEPPELPPHESESVTT